MRRLTLPDLYLMVRRVHRNLLDRERWPDVSQMDTQILDEIDRALWGASEAVKEFRQMVQRELQARGENVFSMPLRPVEDFDPEKNRMDL